MMSLHLQWVDEDSLVNLISQYDSCLYTFSWFEHQISTAHVSKPSAAVWASKSAWTTSCDQHFSIAKNENKQRTHGQEVKNIKAPAVWGPTMLIPWFDLKPLVWEHRQKSEYTEGLQDLCGNRERSVSWWGKNNPYSVLVQMHEPEYNCFFKLKWRSRITAHYSCQTPVLFLSIRLSKLCKDGLCSYIGSAPFLQ